MTGADPTVQIRMPSGQSLVTLLEKATPGVWYYQPGHGIEVWSDGACGLLIYAEQGCRASEADQDLMALAPVIGRELQATHVALTAQAAALAQVTAERDAFRKAVTVWANLSTNGRASMTPEQLASALQVADEATRAHGCEACAGATFEDGVICCWTCGRVLPSQEVHP